MDLKSGAFRYALMISEKRVALFTETSSRTSRSGPSNWAMAIMSVGLV